MPDLSAGFDTPNPYGLMAGDFGYDLDAYHVALRFLSDLSGGSVEAEALEANGGSPAQLRAWERNEKFRRVLGKCRRAGETEREDAKLEKAVEVMAEVVDVAKAVTAGNATAEERLAAAVEQGATKRVAWEDAPPTKSTFSGTPNPSGWGSA